MTRQERVPTYSAVSLYCESHWAPREHGRLRTGPGSMPPAHIHLLLSAERSDLRPTEQKALALGREAWVRGPAPASEGPHRLY
jgi:hypothetical protein